MIVLGSAKRAQQTRHCRTLGNGFSFHRSEWMESGQGGTMSPTVFLVEQPPHSVLATGGRIGGPELLHWAAQ